jgi:hypothetical protein
VDGTSWRRQGEIVRLRWPDPSGRLTRRWPESRLLLLISSMGIEIGEVEEVIEIRSDWCFLDQRQGTCKACSAAWEHALADVPVCRARGEAGHRVLESSVRPCTRPRGRLCSLLVRALLVMAGWWSPLSTLRFNLLCGSSYCFVFTESVPRASTNTHPSEIPTESHV